ncbi:30S ribosomal protein S21 [Dirofilaria immitis]|nr:30S ribosomal protein S21 [Dirofilaria immitis]
MVTPMGYDAIECKNEANVMSLIEVSVHYGDVVELFNIKKTIQKEGRGVKIKKQYHEKKSEIRAKKKAEVKKRGANKRAEGNGMVGLGAMVRPLSASAFGHIGDRYGRKMALMIAILLIAIPSSLIAFIPSYSI